MTEKTKSKSKGIVSWPTTERPREKLKKLGPEALSDGELLAVLLRIGKSGQSAKDLGRQLLDKFNGISGIDRAHMEELIEVSGMGTAKAAQLKAAIELGKRVRMKNVEPRRFDRADNVAAYIRPRFEGKRQECFLILLLDGQNRLIAERLITEGIPTQATVYIRRVMEEALRVSASAFVVVHNHPSDNTSPSISDDKTTQDLKKAADLLNLVFLDHIIIGSKDSYYSYAEDNKI